MTLTTLAASFHSSIHLVVFRGAAISGFHHVAWEASSCRSQCRCLIDRFSFGSLAVVCALITTAGSVPIAHSEKRLRRRLVVSASCYRSMEFPAWERYFL